MRSHLPTRRRRNRSGSRLCGYRKFLRVAIEPLEELVMLDGPRPVPLPAAIIVGRMLSSYIVGGIKATRRQSLTPSTTSKPTPKQGCA